MTDTKKDDPTRLKIGTKELPIRFSYAYLFEPRVDEKKVDPKTGEKEKKYSLMVLVPKGDKAGEAAIRAAILAAAKEKMAGKTNFPPSWNYPLRDGDLEWEEKGEALKGHWFFNCTSRQKPAVVGTKRDIENKLVPLSQEEFKSGDYGRVSVNFYWFEMPESKGIGVGLGNVQKLKDGEALGNRRSADDDFGDLEDDDGFED